VRRSFAGQATAFEDRSRAFGQPAVMNWMSANTPAEPGDLVLEVAAGTALFSRALAARVAAVVAIDLTPEMLLEGHRAAAEAGHRNIVFQLGDATALPFLDLTFDRSISRLAVHHFEDARVPIAEMKRVTRIGGTVTVIDMVVVDKRADTLTVFNDLERRRDPAHTNALSRSGLREAILAAGLEIEHTATWENVLDSERWLEQTATPIDEADVIRSAWEQELAGGASTGMSPRRTADGRIEFVHAWDLVVARR
jgi:SAM-dependent methyltransferase